MFSRFVIDEKYRFTPHERMRMGSLMKLPDEPCITVVMPVFNQEKQIGESIASVLSQDYRNIDLLVMDGASTDGTLEVVRSFSHDKRLRWFSEPDRCPNEATLKGLKMANGHCFGVQCSSDTYLPGVIRRAAEEFVKDPTLFCVGGLCREIKLDGKEAIWDAVGGSSPEYLTADQMLIFNTIPPVQSSFYRREVLFSLGGFDERFRTCHTVYFLHFMLEGVRMGGRALALPEMWGVFNRHKSSVTSNIRDHTQDVYREQVLTSNHAAEVFSDILTEAQKDFIRRRLYLPEEERKRLESFQAERQVSTRA